MRLFSIYRNIILNISWAVLGKVISMLGTVVMGIFVARYLGPSDYGLLKYSIAFVTIFSVLGRFGSDNIIIKELARKNEKKPEVIGSSFMFRLVASVFTIFLIISSTCILEEDNKTRMLVAVFSLSLLAVPLDVARLYFKSIVQNQYIIKSEIIRTIISSILKVVLIISGMDIWWFVAVFAIDLILPAYFCYFFYRKHKEFQGRPRFNRIETKFLLKESFPLLLSGIAAILSQNVDQILLKNISGSAELAQYAVAYSLLSLILFVPQVVGNTVAPILVRKHEESQKVYYESMQLFFDIMFWCTLVVTLIISITSIYIVPALYGVEYNSSGEVLQVLAWKSLATSFGISTGYFIIIEGKQRFLIYRDTIGLVINVGVNLVLIPKIGATGAAIAAVISYFCATYFSHYLFNELEMVVKIQNRTILYGIKNIYKNYYHLLSSNSKKEKV